MADKNKSTKDETSTQKKASNMDWRPWVFRGAVISFLVFVFVTWQLYGRLGPLSILLGLLFVVLIMGWLGVSYFLLNR